MSPYKSNVICKISCNNCDASYVGQTGRQLKIRITEHRNHIRHNTSVRSVITEHRLQYDHDFQWDNVKILEEPCYRKPLISEMLNIKKQKNSVNLQTDTEGLHKAYIPIVNKVWLFFTDGPSLLSVRISKRTIIIDTQCPSYTSAFYLSLYFYGFFVLIWTYLFE